MQVPSPLPTRRSFLKTATLLGSGALAAPLLRAQDSAATTKLLAYVGTYTSPLQNMKATQVDLPPGNGRGIHIFEVDRASGAMTPLDVVEMGTSPSFVLFNAKKTHLYSANETERIGEGEEGSVSAFAVDPATGRLRLLNSVPSGGKGPTYLGLHPSGRFLFVANYFGGSVAVLPIHPDGTLGTPTDVKKDEGTIGPRKATNAQPGSFAFSGHDQTHAHMIEADPAGKFVIHVDLGLDQILVWKFDTEKGVLTPNDPPHISLPPGDGPRHFSFHPNGRWMYSIQEEGSTVVLFDYEAATGRLTARQTISSLPPGTTGSNFCSEVMVSPDGRFVYAGNRLHDSIALFAVGADGTLSFVEETWTHGDYPRSFSFTPDASHLYCCNQRADNLACFRIDKASGKLQFTGQLIPVGNPSLVTFLELSRVAR